jgi:hypothetical protein
VKKNTKSRRLVDACVRRLNRSMSSVCEIITQYIPLNDALEVPGWSQEEMEQEGVSVPRLEVRLSQLRQV